jgi:hypothetical protein
MMLILLLLSLLVIVTGYINRGIVVINNKYYSSNDNDNNSNIPDELELYKSKNELLEQGIKLIRIKMIDTINENIKLKSLLTNTNANANTISNDKTIINNLESQLKQSLINNNKLKMTIDNERNINKELSNNINDISNNMNNYILQIDTYKSKLKILQKVYDNNNNELNIIKDKYYELEKQYNNVININEKNDIVNTINEFMLTFKQQSTELQDTQRSIQNIEQKFLNEIRKFEGEYSQSSAIFNYMIACDLRDQRRIIDKQTSMIQSIVSQLDTELPAIKATIGSSDVTSYNIPNIPSTTTTISSSISSSISSEEVISNNNRIVESARNLGANINIKKRVKKVARTVIDAVSFLFAKGPYYETLSSSDVIDNNYNNNNNIWNNLVIDTNQYEIDSTERNSI